MDMPSLVADLKASLSTFVVKKFLAEGDADFKRLLRRALLEMQAKRPATRPGEVGLFPHQPRYRVLADDFAQLKTHLWADPARTPPPWEPGYPGAVPRVAAAWDGLDWWLEFTPAPTPRQIAAWGPVFRFFYFARHVLPDAGGISTLAEDDRGLLLLRAQAEAMRELAMRNVVITQEVRDGYSGTARNGTPAALFKVLLDEFAQAR
jgi:hypothetical protein